jgi:hypothetical protein
MDLFNEVLKPDRETPRQWCTTRLTVIYKKGDKAMPGNYRPIATRPIMDKLFSRMLSSRIQPTLLAHQPPDQAAYRAGYSTEDHLVTVSVLTEAFRERNSDLWLGLVDFEKAFDTALWRVLEQQHVHDHYVHVLRKLYEHQLA